MQISGKRAHPRSLTLNVLSMSLVMLLYTDSYLESFVFFLSYAAVHRLWNLQISGEGSDLVMVDVFHHLVQQPLVHLLISVVLRLLAASRHFLRLSENSVTVS